MSGVTVTVKSPLVSSPISLETTADDSISTVKQYLLSLGQLEQPLTAFELASNGTMLRNDTPLSELPTADGEIALEMSLQSLSAMDVSVQLEQLREVLGLGPISSKYVNAGATRLHEIKKGGRKGKKLNEDEILDLAEVPDFVLEAAEVSADLEGKGSTTAASLGPSPSVAYPDALVPKPSGIELGYSRWQPLCRSPQLKLTGVLAFVRFVSNDSREWHFVAKPEGFTYVPGLSEQSIELPTRNARYVPTLIQAIEQVSPSSINSARKSADKTKADPLSCVPIPQVTSVAPWLVGDVPKISGLHVSAFEVPEETTLRDWNEDYQSTRELEVETFSERIIRDRSLCHTSTEFASAATEGVVKIVEGAIRPLDPYEDCESAKLFLSKGIFYTYGSDFSQAYAGVESAAAAKKAVKKGISGVEQLMMLNNPELCPVLTAVVDYCGRRVVAQAPVPGIFREIPLIVYGQSEETDKVHFDETIDKHMQQFAEHLHLKKHPVTKEGLELHTSAEVHGAKSTDGRYYAIDLHRMQVPDLLFEGGDELDLLRFEAVLEYFARNPDAEKLNPDVWLPSDRIPKEYAVSQLAKDADAVKAVSAFVRETVIPSMVNDVVSGTGIDPIDGFHLTALMHNKGINMRHLGSIYALAQSAGLQSLSAVAFEEAVARSLKSLLRLELEEVKTVDQFPVTIESFVTKFRNPAPCSELTSKVENRLKKHFGFHEVPSGWQKWLLLRNSLLRSVSIKCGLQWNEKLELVAINPVVRYAFPRSLTAADAIEAGRISLEAAVRPNVEGNNDDPKNENDDSSENTSSEGEVGTTQKETRESSPEQEVTTTDKEPVEHETAESPSESEDSKGAPDGGLNTELLEQTLTVVSQAVGVYTQIYGTSNAEVAHVLNQVATLFYEYGNDTGKAIEYVRKAITIAERVKGIDSYDVIVMYNNLAYFERSAGNWATTLQVANRVTSTVSQFAWPGFTDAATIFENVAVMLLQSHKPKLQKASIDWFVRAIDLAKMTPRGPSGLLWFQYAQAQIFQHDYKNASRTMEASYNTFKANNGPEDASTKEVKGYLEQLLKVTVSTAHSEAHRARVMASLHGKTQLKSAQNVNTSLRGNLNSSPSPSTKNSTETNSKTKKSKKKSSKKKSKK